MIILFKYCANVENYESFKGFGYIYIERNDISTTILVQLYIYIYIYITAKQATQV